MAGGGRYSTLLSNFATYPTAAELLTFPSLSLQFSKTNCSSTLIILSARRSLSARVGQAQRDDAVPNLVLQRFLYQQREPFRGKSANASGSCAT